VLSTRTTEAHPRNIYGSSGVRKRVLARHAYGDAMSIVCAAATARVMPLLSVW
jgi:hypothetical protein